MATFEGFSGETIDFMWELRFNNNREWMDQNRDRYKRVLKEPFEQFVPALMQEFSPVVKDDLKWSISRINRDIRFSKDKSPYRSCRWIASKHSYMVGTEWKFRPEFFFELSPESYSYGMGIFAASTAYSKQYRAKIDSNPAAFLRLIRQMAKFEEYHLIGDEYKRIPNPNEHDEEILAWYRQKSPSFIVQRPLDDLVFSEDLPKFLVEEWKKIMPLYEFLKEINVE